MHSHTLSDDARIVQQEIFNDLIEWKCGEIDCCIAIERYFEKSDSRFVARIEEIVKALPPLDLETRAVVCMPVVAFHDQDSSILARTLKRLDISSSGYPPVEVMVLCNWPKGKQRDSAPEVALKISQEVTSLSISVASVELDFNEQNAGYYRALMHGIVLLRTLKSGIANDIVHISMDADTVRIPRGYVKEYLKVFAANPEIDAVVGQLDWDNETIQTVRIPELYIGNELMRLLPKHGNWRVLSRQELYDEALIGECVFSRRSFGRGVQANIAWKGSAYARVGGYRTEPHDELDYILRKIFASGKMKNIAFLWDEVAIASDSRRALWALKKFGMPPMRQWAVSFQADDPVRRFLPDLAEHINAVAVADLERQINLTLEVFNMPREPLQAAVIGALAELGLGYNDYDLFLEDYQPDPALSIASIRITDDRALRPYLGLR